MTNLTFYGGINQIGGNKILIEDRRSDASVFLDFGMNFTEHGRYFEEFIQPRTANGMMDLLELGIIPNIKGIYRHDLLEFAGMEKHKEPIVDAVILSHAHLDHAAHISFLDERIPIICSAITKTILKVLQEVGRRSMEYEVLDFKRRPILDYRDAAVERKFITVKGKFNVNGLEVELVPVDHSIPGACGVIIYASDKTIAYTGDLRMHGTYAHLTEEFVERLKIAKPDVFLCEGTRIDETERNTEAYVKVNSGKAVSETGGLVIADFAFKDLTRFNTFFEVAKESERKLAIPFKDAYYVKELAKIIPGIPSIKNDDILLYQKKKGSGTYIEKDYEDWELDFLDWPNTVKADYIHKHQKEVVIALGYYDMPDLVDLRPEKGSIYIKSASEAHNEEEQIDLNRLGNWLSHFGLGYKHVHASGHAPGTDIAKMINEVKPRLLIPIHTEKPDEFSKLVSNKIDIELPSLTKC